MWTNLLFGEIIVLASPCLCLSTIKLNSTSRDVNYWETTPNSQRRKKYVWEDKLGGILVNYSHYCVVLIEGE